MVIGITIFISSFPLIWKNEREDVKAYRIINKASKRCYEVDCSNIDPRYNGKLICTSGILKANSPVVDIITGYSKNNVTKLIRKVEIY